jgi:uncharacterized protein
VPLRVYDETIRVLKTAVRNAKLGRDEELAALKRLDAQARLLERHAGGPSVEQLSADERARSQSYRGRSVFVWAKPGPSDLLGAATTTERSNSQQGRLQRRSSS